MFSWLRGCFYRRSVMLLTLLILFLCGMCHATHSNTVYLETGCNSSKVQKVQIDYSSTVIDHGKNYNYWSYKISWIFLNNHLYLYFHLTYMSKYCSSILIIITSFIEETISCKNVFLILFFFKIRYIYMFKSNLQMRYILVHAHYCNYRRKTHM